jgi:hypothetical protein
LPLSACCLPARLPACLSACLPACLPACLVGIFDFGLDLIIQDFKLFKQFKQIINLACLA